MRRAGTPTRTARTAPAAPGGGQAEEEIGVGLLDQVAGQDAADAGEGELAQAHVARPAGEHHQ